MSSSQIRVLVIDDEDLICWSLSKELGREGYSVSTATTGTDGLLIFDQVNPEIVLLDHRLPGAEGVEILREIKHREPSTVVIMMTAYGSVKTAVEAMKQGAFEYVNKPFDMDEIKLLISRAIDAHKIESEILEMRRLLKKTYGLSQLVHDTPEMKRIHQTVKQVAQAHTTTILIQGESGTGKEVVARAIHYESPRSSKPFVTINCSALPETLLESELFGHEKGAFTDARATKKGQLEFGEGGTVFLDEIGDISPAIQAKLLGLLENKTFKRLGGTADIRLDARIIVATNRNLEAAVNNGTFRKDLYYRLKVIQIMLPPLRERREDIPLLCHHFIGQFNREFKQNVAGISPEAVRMLHEYDWPGNVRELRNVIERALILGQKLYVDVDVLPPEITGHQTKPEDAVGSAFHLPEGGVSLDEMERIIIVSALERSGGNQSQAARLLSVSRDVLRGKMQRLGLLPTKSAENDATE